MNERRNRILNMTNSIGNYNEMSNLFNINLPNVLFNTNLDTQNIVQNNSLTENVIIALTDEEFDKIEEIKYEDIDDQNKCNICLDTFEESSKILKLKCGHIFHYDCIKNWLQNHNNKCPVCREEIAKGHPINL